MRDVSSPFHVGVPDIPAMAETTLQSLLALSFDEARAREAIEAIGDKADVGMAINWLLDHGEEDRGGAVQLQHCPHLAAHALLPPRDLVFVEGCAEGCSSAETWLCLSCGATRCSRYVRRHALAHFEETRASDAAGRGHHVALSASDLSVWCYLCEAYISNPQVQPHCEAYRRWKFDEPPRRGGAAASSEAGSSAQHAAAACEEPLPLLPALPHGPTAGGGEEEAEESRHQWVQWHTLRHCEGVGGSPPSPARTAPAAAAPPRESECAWSEGASSSRLLRLTVRSRGDLRTLIHKAEEGTLLLMGKEAEEAFEFASPSWHPATLSLEEWILHATNDLKFRLPASLPQAARDQAKLHVAALEACLAAEDLPFDILVSDPTGASHIGASSASPTANPIAPPYARCSSLSEFAQRLQSARHVIVLLGAGASVSAGIPDFRSPGTGLYDNLAKYNLPFPEAVFDLDFFVQNPWPFYQLSRELWPGGYSPTAAHHFVKLLHDRQQLLRCYTQNIDSLEALAGLPKDKVVAAHGNFDSAHVVGRDVEVPIELLREATLRGEDATRELNEQYGGLCKPSITFFGEALPKRFGELAPEDFELCDLLVVMGTSLKVQPFACLATFPSVGVPRLLINRDRVGPFHFVSDGDLPIDLVTDVFFQGDCDDGVRELARLAGMLPALESLMAK
ncbi:hypothetical protein AB1Y20_004186 [Prymnesium parvum]|uniref:ubiquitinyl hydrolase 1 n=1 Tax=Prymnesium parvum TaxID=97485 RepID=A0AB34J991_PRYPA